jgi:hypothetical protein
VPHSPRLSRGHGGPRPHAPVVMALALASILGACSTPYLTKSAPRPSLRVADAAMAAGVPEMALRVADLILEEQPRNVPALVARGDALYAMSRRDIAQDAYRAAIIIDPGAAGAQIGLGRTLAHSNPRAAEAAFEIALAHDPDNVIALNNLGVVRDLQGRDAEAQRAYRHALTVAPASTDVRINLGMSLALSGHLDEAVQELRETAATPDATQKWREELVAGLTLAGDAAWAKQMLLSDPGEAPKDPANPVKPDRLRLAVTSPLALPNEKGRPLRAAAIPLPASGGSSGEPPRTSAVSPSIVQALVAEMPPNIKVPAPDPAPLTSVVLTDLPPIGSTPGNASVAVLPIDAEPDQSAAHRSSGIRPSMPPDDTGVARLASSAAEMKMQIAAWLAAREPAMTPHASTSSAFVQIASLLSEPAALFEWHRMSKRLSGMLLGRKPTITPAEARGRIYWRLRTFGFADINEANDFCGQMKATGFGCWAGRGL